MYVSELQLFHYVLERGHARGDVFGLVGEGFEEAGRVFLSIQADYECLKG